MEVNEAQRASNIRPLIQEIEQLEALQRLREHPDFPVLERVVAAISLAVTRQLIHSEDPATSHKVAGKMEAVNWVVNQIVDKVEEIREKKKLLRELDPEQPQVDSGV